MSKRLAGVGWLLSSVLVCVTSAAEDVKKTEDKTEEAAPSETRSLLPTASDLEPYSLSRTEKEIALKTSDDAPGSTLFGVSGYLMFGASAADFATTELGLGRGLSEGNPVASSRSARLLHHVVGPAAVYWTTDRLQRSGKNKLALSLRIALMAAYGYGAVHNLRQVGSLPGPR